MNAVSPNGYRHTQTGPWSWLLGAIAVVLATAAWFARREPVALVLCPSISTVMLILAASFHGLTVADEGDRLAIFFGPLPLFRTSVRYDEITGFEAGRTTVLDGWGIHMSVRGGWVWNIFGRDCVVIHRERGKLHIGTDDVEGLIGFLHARRFEPDAV